MRQRREHSRVGLRVRGSALGLVLLGATIASFAPPPAAAQSINGTLIDGGSEEPIPLGVVMMLTLSGDTVSYTITDAQGYFDVSSPTPGSFILVGMALGYRDTRAGVFELGEDGVMSVQYRLSPEPIGLEELIVSLDRPVLEHRLIRNGFVERAQRGVGAFITPADIAESSATSTEQLLNRVPGVRVGAIRAVRTATNDSSVVMPRADIGDAVQMRAPNGGWCDPIIYVDGQRVRYENQVGFSLSTLASLATVDGIEVYRRPAEVPVEYAATQAGNSQTPFSTCGDWSSGPDITKHPRDSAVTHRERLNRCTGCRGCTGTGGDAAPCRR